MNNMTHEEYKQRQATAQALLSRHDHNLSDHDPNTKENCGACTLGGYHRKNERKDFINYAGWARVYVEAGKYIPKNLRYAFLAELASSNRSYADALKQDIRDFGINCDDESFRHAINEVLEIWD